MDKSPLIKFGPDFRQEFLFFDVANGGDFDRTLTYYIAGPMTGLPNFNYPTFDRATKFLRRNGLNVESPHEAYAHESEEEREGSRPYLEYIQHGINLLFKCNGMILLPGWYMSSGVMQAELPLARMMRYPIYFLDGDRLLDMAHRSE